MDQRQSLHLNQVFQAARQAGFAPEPVELCHLGFGTVNGPDGRPFKTRTGGAMKLEDLIVLTIGKARAKMQEAGVGAAYPPEEQTVIAEKVGIAALKYADLMTNRTSDYSFDPDRFVNFEGKTGPYLIYTAVRIKSIFRKLTTLYTPSEILPPSERETQLLLSLVRLPEAIDDTYHNHSPHVLCEYAYQLAQAFNRFYQHSHILNETDAVLQKSWLTTADLTLKTLALILDLLAIDIPERM